MQQKLFKIKSVSELIGLLDTGYTPNDFFLRRLYRGQSNANWKLTPSIFRYKSNYQPEIAEQLLISNFKRMAKGLIKYIPKDDIEWLTLAQHHGLPTRLLDWSYSPLFALYFAVQDLTKDGALYHVVVNDTKLEEFQGSELQHVEENDPCYVIPEHITDRVAKQSACFLLLPQSRKFFNLDAYFSKDKCPGIFDLRKYVIPKENKRKIRNQLSDLGVTEFVLFPDLDGLARHLKTELIVR